MKSGARLVLLVVAAAGAAYVRSTLNPLQETIRVSLALSDNQMALLQGAALALPVAIAAAFIGVLIDRVSRVRLLATFSFAALIGTVATAGASTFTQLFLSRCVVGLASIASNPTLLSLLSDLYAPEKRGRATMIVAIAQYGGMSAAFILGGVLLTQLGGHVDVWRAAMLGLAGPLVAVIVMILRMTEPKRTGQVAAQGSSRGSYGELWRRRAAIAPPMIAVIIAEIPMNASLVWSAPALTRKFGLSAAAVGLTVAVGLILSGILGPIIGGVLADRCQARGGARRTLSMLALLALIASVGGLFSVMPSSSMAAGVFATFVTALSAIIVMGTSLLLVVVPGELRGTCMSAFTGACVVVGVGLAPLLVSVLSDALGGPSHLGAALAVVNVAAGLLAAGVLSIGRPWKDSIVEST